jgi:hypothetical protein
MGHTDTTHAAHTRSTCSEAHDGGATHITCKAAEEQRFDHHLESAQRCSAGLAEGDAPATAVSLALCTHAVCCCVWLGVCAAASACKLMMQHHQSCQEPGT